MRPLLLAAMLLPLTGCLGGAPVVRSAPAHAGSLDCAEASADLLSYTIYGHTADGSGFTAEKREGSGHAGAAVSREVLLVDLFTEEEPTLRVTATAGESVTDPSSRQRHLPREAAPATVRDAEAILRECAGG